MTYKPFGSSKEVGCGHCHSLVNCHDCCRCIPRTICVEITGIGEDCSCTCTHLGIPCGLDGSYSYTWDCGDLSIDMLFTIEKDGLECYVFLESECLGLTGENRGRSNAITSGLKCVDWEADFNGLDASGCGDEDCFIDIAARPMYASEHTYGKGCEGCTNCQCVPNRLCVTYTGEPDSCSAIGFVDFDEDNQEWTGSVKPLGDDNQYCADEIDIVISLGKNGDNDCTLALELTGGVTLSGDPIVITEDTCPDQLSATWDLPGDHTVSIEVDYCQLCLHTMCCPNGLPLSLTADFSAVNCSALDGLSVALTFNASTGRWEGTNGVCDLVTVKFWCKDPDNVCEQMDCSGWALSLGIGFACNLEESPNVCECDPAEFEFVFSGVTCDCCDMGGGTVTVTVTE